MVGETLDGGHQKEFFGSLEVCPLCRYCHRLTHYSIHELRVSPNFFHYCDTSASALPSTPSSSPSSTLTTSPAPAPTTLSPSPPSALSSIISSSTINDESSSSHSHSAVVVGSILGAVVSSLIWMWHDVHEGEDDQDASLDAQLRSPGDASPQSSGDERDDFLYHSEDASHSIKAATPSSTCCVLPTNHLVQSASRWLQTAKQVLHFQDRDISSHQSSCR